MGGTEELKRKVTGLWQDRKRQGFQASPLCVPRPGVPLLPLFFLQGQFLLGPGPSSISII